MNYDAFMKWLINNVDAFKKDCNGLEPVLIIDTTPYHSDLLETVPSSSWRKKDMQDWLLSKSIQYPIELTKQMPYDEIIRPLCHEHKKYAIDELDRQHNVIILSLPPYHCILNPIELLWAKVKGDLRKRNRIKNKLSEVVNICRDVFSESTVDFCSSVYSRTDAGETDDENANPLGGHGRKSRYNLRSLSSRRSLANDDVTQELTKLQKNVRHIKSQAASSEGSEDESTRLRRRSTRAIARTGSNVTRSSSPPALTRRRMASASSSSSVVSSSQSGQQAKKIKHRTTSKGVESEVDVKTRDGNNRKSARRSSRRLTMMK
uniref:Tc1-like transposase DDE domain-containing protein n=1 Tax=Plectus sambesii TaxID=2011161 RepID=A0A914W6D3_9BILA